MARTHRDERAGERIRLAHHEGLRRKLNEFFALLENAGTATKSRRDAHRHFAYWLRRELLRERGERGGRASRCGGATDGGVGIVLHDNSPERFRQEDLW